MTQLDQQLAYLHNLRRFEVVKPGLGTMVNLLAALDNPHHKFPSIHIAGTNGKGSTAAFIHNILTQSSLNTIGLYTSPYLRQFNERIRINDRHILDEELISLISRTRSKAIQHGLEPSYFEFMTAFAFLHFAEAKVDLAVIEAGMGGLLDATNVLTPQASVITNVGHDHQQWLGQSKREIAIRKAGIIKAGVPVITAETDDAIISIFEKICRQKNTQLYQVDQLLSPKIIKQSLSAQTFSTSGVINDTFSIPLLGAHQVTNACTALTTLHTLNQLSPMAALKQGLKETEWDGRLQIVSKKPFILIDGAHNPEGIAALLDFLESTPSLPPLDTLILGLKENKDPIPMTKQLVKLFRRVIVTESRYLPMPASYLAQQISAHHPNVQSIPNLRDALAEAKAHLTPNTMLLITGSLYLIGDTLKGRLLTDQA